jgi:hypothetical protein
VLKSSIDSFIFKGYILLIILAIWVIFITLNVPSEEIQNLFHFPRERNNDVQKCISFYFFVFNDQPGSPLTCFRCFIIFSSCRGIIELQIKSFWFLVAYCGFLAVFPTSTTLIGTEYFESNFFVLFFWSQHKPVQHKSIEVTQFSFVLPFQVWHYQSKSFLKMSIF